MAAHPEAQPLRLLGKAIPAGETTDLELALPQLSPHLPASLPVRVIRSKRAGPRLLITAVIHGDEIIGIEIISRLLASGYTDNLICGDIVIIPVVNLFGYLQRSRYLPDGRDLNRCFPGATKGSLTARLARLLQDEILPHCTHGIDLHSGADSRTNLPQIRLDRNNPGTEELAKAFSPPLILKGKSPPGSFRAFAAKKRIPMILFEGSLAARFEEEPAEVGWRGIVGVLQHLGMLEPATEPVTQQKPVIIDGSSWQRASENGILHLPVLLGEPIRKGQHLGHIADFFGTKLANIKATKSGIVIGQTLTPALYEGDPLLHIGHSGTE